MQGWLKVLRDIGPTRKEVREVVLGRRSKGDDLGRVESGTLVSIVRDALGGRAGTAVGLVGAGSTVELENTASSLYSPV